MSIIGRVRYRDFLMVVISVEVTEASPIRFWFYQLSCMEMSTFYMYIICMKPHNVPYTVTGYDKR